MRNWVKCQCWWYLVMANYSEISFCIEETITWFTSMVKLRKEHTDSTARMTSVYSDLCGVGVCILAKSKVECFIHNDSTFKQHHWFSHVDIWKLVQIKEKQYRSLEKRRNKYYLDRFAEATAYILDCSCNFNRSWWLVWAIFRQQIFHQQIW